jgi:hypothetical protein
MREFSLTVTPEQWKRAQRCNAHGCGIEVAVQDKFPNARHIQVDVQSIRWSIPEDDKRYLALTPKVFQRSLVSYDQGIMPGTVKSFVRISQEIARRHVETEVFEPKRTKTIKRGRRQRDLLITGGRLPPVNRALRTFGIKALGDWSKDATI